MTIFTNNMLMGQRKAILEYIGSTTQTSLEFPNNTDIVFPSVNIGAGGDRLVILVVSVRGEDDEGIVLSGSIGSVPLTINPSLQSGTFTAGVSIVYALVPNLSTATITVRIVSDSTRVTLGVYTLKNYISPVPMATSSTSSGGSSSSPSSLSLPFNPAEEVGLAGAHIVTTGSSSSDKSNSIIWTNGTENYDTGTQQTGYASGAIVPASGTVTITPAKDGVTTGLEATFRTLVAAAWR